MFFQRKIAISILLLLATSVGAPGEDVRFKATGAYLSNPEEVDAVKATPLHRAFLPAAVDLSRFFPAVGDQGDLGSCVGWAVGYAARAYYAQIVEGRPPTSLANIPSPAYIHGSIVEDRSTCSGGTTLLKGLEVLVNGSLSLQEFPYSDRSCSIPSALQTQAATDFKIDSFSRVDFKNLDQVKAQLAVGNPVIIGVKPDESFFDLTGSEIWQAPPGDISGIGHAVTLVAYNDHNQTFKFINSWGRSWGQSGYGFMDYQTLSNRTREAFVMDPPGAVPKPAPAVPPVPVAPDTPPSPPITPDPAIQVTGVECGKVVVRAEGEKLIAEGFVGSKEDLKLVDAQLEGLVSDNRVALRPWPQCEALLTLDQHLQENDRPEIQISDEELEAGEILAVDVRAPEFESYLHVAYFQADGSVVHLHQPEATKLETIAPLAELRFGDGEDGRSTFRISAPFGREMLLVLASPSPLFAQPRPTIETEREFLTALRIALASRPTSSDTARLVSAAYKPLVTSGSPHIVPDSPTPGKRSCVERELTC